jgi:hypothetical protein
VAGDRVDSLEVAVRSRRIEWRCSERVDNNIKAPIPQMATINECRYRWLSVRDLNLSRRAGLLNRPSEAYITHWTKADATVLHRTPQRNRNELGETTVNKTWRKGPPQQEKSIAYETFTAFGTQGRFNQITT